MMNHNLSRFRFHWRAALLCLAGLFSIQFAYPAPPPTDEDQLSRKFERFREAMVRGKIDDLLAVGQADRLLSMPDDTTLETAEQLLVRIRSYHTEERKRLFATLRVEEIFVDDEDGKVAMILAKAQNSAPPQYELVWCIRRSTRPWAVMVNWAEPKNAINQLPDSALGAVGRIVDTVKEKYLEVAHPSLVHERSEGNASPSSAGQPRPRHGRAEQDGAGQPATAPESNLEGEEKPKTESEVRPQ